VVPCLLTTRMILVTILPRTLGGLIHAEADPKVQPESVRTPMVGSPRRGPVCQAWTWRPGRQSARPAAPGSGAPVSARRRRGKRGIERSGHS